MQRYVKASNSERHGGIMFVAVVYPWDLRIKETGVGVTWLL